VLDAFDDRPYQEEDIMPSQQSLRAHTDLHQPQLTKIGQRFEIYPEIVQRPVKHFGQQIYLHGRILYSDSALLQTGTLSRPYFQVANNPF
jgi:hypothetical protein